jgi:hypothetical protein
MCHNWIAIEISGGLKPPSGNVSIDFAPGPLLNRLRGGPSRIAIQTLVDFVGLCLFSELSPNIVLGQLIPGFMGNDGRWHCQENILLGLKTERLSSGS